MNHTLYNYKLAFELNYFLVALIKLGLSIGFSFIISIERELHSHPGGVCTHILVGLGSCLYTMLSIHIQEKYNSNNGDPARICAQIVSGMGFLGSATIFKSKDYVKGINTAANLWISAAISMSIGADLWEFGFVTALFVIIILFINNGYKKVRYSYEKKHDIEMGNMNENNRSNVRHLTREAVDAPYGDENQTNMD